MPTISKNINIQFSSKDFNSKYFPIEYYRSLATRKYPDILNFERDINAMTISMNNLLICIKEMFIQGKDCVKACIPRKLFDTVVSNHHIRFGVILHKEEIFHKNFCRALIDDTLAEYFTKEKGSNITSTLEDEKTDLICILPKKIKYKLNPYTVLADVIRKVRSYIVTVILKLQRRLKPVVTARKRSLGSVIDKSKGLDKFLGLIITDIPMYHLSLAIKNIMDVNIPASLFHKTL